MPPGIASVSQRYDITSRASIWTIVNKAYKRAQLVLTIVPGSIVVSEIALIAWQILTHTKVSHKHVRLGQRQCAITVYTIVVHPTDQWKVWREKTKPITHNNGAEEQHASGNWIIWTIGCTQIGKI